jgi:cysteine synthase
MPALDLGRDVADTTVLARTAAHLRERGIRLPTFAELAEPARIPAAARAALASVDPDAPDAANLCRVHWHNAADRRGFARTPEHVVLPRALTGVDATVALALGDRFPLIRAHKVLAAYACLAPRLATGRFDPTRQRAIWPSTGNYCRGGVAISKILGCRGVAVLPENMSRERFEWLARWVESADDVVRTPGSESNVKEIYDRCEELERDPRNVVLNQFSEFGNHLAHFTVTGRALERVFEALRERDGALQLAAFVSATGSAGTIGAGDHLKERFGARIAAVEALECPTLLENGYGEHNIQGIGDKHVPLIHNAMNTDLVVAVSDRTTDALYLLFNTDAGRAELARRGVPSSAMAGLASFGLSSICNLVASILIARHAKLGASDVVLSVATDGAEMYESEVARLTARDYPRGFGPREAAAVFEQHLAGPSTEHVLELDGRERRRVFNLGYFTWVEQRGVPLADFERRRSQGWWRELRQLVPAWDARIEELNGRAGVAR